MEEYQEQKKTSKTEYNKWELNESMYLSMGSDVRVGQNSFSNEF